LIPDWDAEVAESYAATMERYEWIRPEEITTFSKGSGKITVFYEGVLSGDIRQGALGDCWLMSAFSIMAEWPKRIIQ